MVREVLTSVTPEEQSKATIEALQAYAQPDELLTENVGESMDAQLAVDGYRAVIAAGMAERTKTERNLELIKRTVVCLPDNNYKIDLEAAEGRVFVRHLQANAVFTPRGSDRAQYIIGSQTRGRQTDLLLADNYQPSTTGLRYFRGNKVMDKYDWITPYVATVPTRNISAALNQAKILESQPLSIQEMLQMTGESIKVRDADTSIRLEELGHLERLNSAWKALAYEVSRRHSSSRGSIPLLESAPAEATGVEINYYPEEIKISATAMKKFNVVDHLAQLAVIFGVGDEVLKEVAAQSAK
jgi:hypothetical protein